MKLNSWHLYVLCNLDDYYNNNSVCKNLAQTNQHICGYHALTRYVPICCAYLRPMGCHNSSGQASYCYRVSDRFAFFPCAQDEYSECCHHIGHMQRSFHTGKQAAQSMNAVRYIIQVFCVYGAHHYTHVLSSPWLIVSLGSVGFSMCLMVECLEILKSQNAWHHHHMGLQSSYQAQTLWHQRYMS